MRIDTSEPSLTALFNKGQVGLIRTEFMRKDDVIANTNELLEIYKKENAALAADKQAADRATFDAIRAFTVLKDENAALAAENERLAEFMKRFDWILYTHNCKGGTSATHDALDKLRNDYLEWMNPEEEQS